MLTLEEKRTLQRALELLIRREKREARECRNCTQPDNGVEARRIALEACVIPRLEDLRDKLNKRWGDSDATHDQKIDEQIKELEKQKRKGR